MLNYGFSTYKLCHVISCTDKVGEINVDKGTSRKLDVIAAENYDILELKDSADKITTKVNINHKINAPVNSGAEAGSIDIMRNDEVVASVKLIVAGKSDKINFVGTFKALAADWLN